MSRNPPKYFTYHDYITVKKSFVYDPDGEFNISFVNDIIKRIHNTLEKELLLHKTFYELKKFISRNHSFLEYGKEKCCNYINYWLNKTVRDSEYGVNKEKFKFFDEFMQRDPKASDVERKIKGIFDKFMKIDPKAKEDKINCTSKLSYIDTDAFEKMKKLYDLYDDFTELKQTKNQLSLCQNITDLAEKYKSTMQQYKGEDSKLFDALTDLKKIIEKDELDVKNKCRKDISDLFFLEIDLPHGNEQNAGAAQAHDRISRETSTPTHVSGFSPHTQKLEKQAEGDRGRTLSRTPERSAPGQTERSTLGKPGPSESSRQPIPSVRRPAPELRQGQLQVQQQGHRPEQGHQQALGSRLPPERPEHPQEQQQEQERHLYTSEDADLFSELEGDIPPEKGDPLADSIFSTFDTEKIMETIKGAVSNVLESVEPVPVLGVSGGMGALYLLFKYTPIGSLFRRNRKNNLYIPNFFDPEYAEQFSGYYPQYYNEGFPNYRMNIAYHPSSEELD
ncbi:PIR protein [Plasmodium vivax]|uniref:VIR protein n=1 Tax=Plasmodium vivax TaxID=5855 RepID=A0A565A787_PLAVI|nr:PIR protein [Plasmodium vivax]